MSNASSSRLIPVEKLTNTEKGVIALMIEDSWKSGQFLLVSDARTKKTNDIALASGLDPKAAERLVAHFDAATELVNTYSPQERRKVVAQVEARLGPPPTP